jgi:hypothetical protein
VVAVANARILPQDRLEAHLALLERQVQQADPVEPQQVEDLVDDPAAVRIPTAPADLRLQEGEVRLAVAIEGDHLAVEDGVG